MSFLTWIKDQSDRQDAIGDFARDVKANRDAERPTAKTTKTGWETYLLSKGACDGAFEAFEAAWAEHRQEGK